MMFHVKQDARPGRATVCREVSAAAEALGLSLPKISAAQVAALGRLACELAPAAARIGLTKYSSPDAVLDRLIVPAVGALVWLNADTPLRVVEVGAGAGAMGMTLAILCPRWRVTLVDRREKACRFAEVVLLRLGLDNAGVLQTDAREVMPLSDRFDATLFRAVASPLEDLAIASGWLRPSGIAVLWTSVAKAESLTTVSEWLLLGRRVVAARNPWAVAAFTRRRNADS